MSLKFDMRKSKELKNLIKYMDLLPVFQLYRRSNVLRMTLSL